MSPVAALATIRWYRPIKSRARTLSFVVKRVIPFELAHQIGDFIAVGEPLMLLHGGAATADHRILRGAVVFGPERTIERDGTFAFRVIVDIAIKALSRATNDPTTAVLSIDQLHRLLRAVGLRHLHDDVIKDEVGKIRVVFRTPDCTTLCSSCREFIKSHGACAPCWITC